MSTAPASPRQPARRRVLRWLGWGTLGAAATAATGGPATALQMLPGSDYAAMIDNSCGTSPYHQQLLDQAAARLGVTLTDDQRRQALAALRCPLCGCPLAAVASASPATPAP